MSQTSLLLFLLSLPLVAQPSLAQQQVVIQVNHVVGTSHLTRSPATFVTAQQERFTVTRLHYYLSNVRLVKADGSAWVLPPDSSYFLIRAEAPASHQITLPHVPVGEYTGLQFMIGVDSLRNTMPPSQRKGCLDIGGEANGMYWSWNAGYIFFKFEGLSPQAPMDKTSGKHEFTFHVGQFGGMKIPTPNNTRLVSLSFPDQPLRVVPGHHAQVALWADLLKVFDGVHSIRIAEHPNVMMQPVAARIADNYSRMFSLQKPQN
ncbi:MbnP family protein [Fibrisoma limi]|nr:MbnP family protein [Fibrisoma limi]